MDPLFSFSPMPISFGTIQSFGQDATSLSQPQSTSAASEDIFSVLADDDSTQKPMETDQKQKQELTERVAMAVSEPLMLSSQATVTAVAMETQSDNLLNMEIEQFLKEYSANPNLRNKFNGLMEKIFKLGKADFVKTVSCLVDKVDITLHAQYLAEEPIENFNLDSNIDLYCALLNRRVFGIKDSTALFGARLFCELLEEGVGWNICMMLEQFNNEQWVVFFKFFPVQASTCLVKYTKISYLQDIFNSRKVRSAWLESFEYLDESLLESCVLKAARCQIFAQDHFEPCPYNTLANALDDARPGIWDTMSLKIKAQKITNEDYAKYLGQALPFDQYFDEKFFQLKVQQLGKL